MRLHYTPTTEPLEPRDLLSTIPILHSYPEAEQTIYLDFDGQIVTESAYNGEGFPVIHAPPFDVDGTKYDSGRVPAFNDDEVSRILSIWERMSEDFRPFNVDVTTEDPSVSDPSIFKQDGVAIRVLFTSRFDSGWGGSGLPWYDGGSSGLAEQESWRALRDVPAWVFSTHPIGAGEIGSHEVGHALGLLHDGDASQTGSLNEYRGPHGQGETRWSPIMGQGNTLTQWSKGEYPHATNFQDDVGRLAFGLGRRPDDHTAIEPLVSDGETNVFREGIIGVQGDTDIFSFEIDQPHTRVAITVDPWHNGPNLDVGVSLFGTPSNLVFGFAESAVNPPDKLSSSFSTELDRGTYFLMVDGVGKEPTADDPGYSDYGSLGYYKITGTIGAPQGRGDINQDGVLSASDIDALYSVVGTALAAVRRDSIHDLNGDQIVDRLDVDVLVREVFRTEYGDFDLDGKVDFGDFLTLAANFGMSQGWAGGDATGDGEVQLADFLLLSAAFGAGQRHF